MFELLALRVAHDRSGLLVGLDGEALLIPTDGFGLLGERGAHAREGAGLRGKLVGGLVVLVKAHRALEPSALGLPRAGPPGQVVRTPSMPRARALATLRSRPASGR